MDKQKKHIGSDSTFDERLRELSASGDPASLRSPEEREALWAGILRDLPQAAAPSSSIWRITWRQALGVAAVFALMLFGAYQFRHFGIFTSPQTDPIADVYQIQITPDDIDIVESSLPVQTEELHSPVKRASLSTDLPVQPEKTDTPFSRKEEVSDSTIAEPIPASSDTERGDSPTPPQERKAEPTIIGPQQREQEKKLFAEDRHIAEVPESRLAVSAQGSALGNFSRRQPVSPAMSLLNARVPGKGSNGTSELAYDYATFRHSPPLRFSLGASYDIAHGFSAIAGINYSYLVSGVEGLRSVNSKALQEVHYLGVHVGGHYNMLNHAGFRLYSGIAVSLEKAISAKIKEYNIGVYPWQFEVMGLVGASYELVPHIALFIEPALTYHPADKTPLKSYYKENPIGLSIGMGLRFRINASKP